MKSDSVSEFTYRFLLFNGGKTKSREYENGGDERQKEYNRLVIEHFINNYSSSRLKRIAENVRLFIMGVLGAFIGLVEGIFAVFGCIYLGASGYGFSKLKNNVKTSYFLSKKDNKELFENAKAEYLHGGKK